MTGGGAPACRQTSPLFGTVQPRRSAMRIALGARAAQVQRIVLADALRLAAIGVALGIAGALATLPAAACTATGPASGPGRSAPAGTPRYRVGRCRSPLSPDSGPAPGCPAPTAGSAPGARPARPTPSPARWCPPHGAAPSPPA